MTAKAVSGALLLAAAQGDSGTIAQRQRQFVKLGMSVARGETVLPEG
jgi:hypothetical protein